VVCGEPCPPGHSVQPGDCDVMIQEMLDGTREKVQCKACSADNTELRCTINEDGYKIVYGE